MSPENKKPSQKTPKTRSDKPAAKLPPEILSYAIHEFIVDANKHFYVDAKLVGETEIDADGNICPVPYKRYRVLHIDSGFGIITLRDKELNLYYWPIERTAIRLPAGKFRVGGKAVLG